MEPHSAEHLRQEFIDHLPASGHRHPGQLANLRIQRLRKPVSLVL
jgi:hypothetical protein